MPAKAGIQWCSFNLWIPAFAGMIILNKKNMISKTSKYAATLSSKLLIGRCEWCTLPQLGVPAIKAKIDTGARTSSIHAFNIEPFFINEKKYVRFDIHPLQQTDNILIKCQAPIADQRYITSSNGHREHRLVIVTTIVLGSISWDIEVTLSNRDPLRYRMLLGREALNHRVLIDPGICYKQRKISRKNLQLIYTSNG